VLGFNKFSIEVPSLDWIGSEERRPGTFAEVEREWNVE
jgi:hypothetical protein